MAGNRVLALPASDRGVVETAEFSRSATIAQMAEKDSKTTVGSLAVETGRV
jgi:hypothetical protein